MTDRSEFPEKGDRPSKCSMNDGRVKPCWVLDDCIAHANPSKAAKGIVLWSFLNMKAKKPTFSRTVIGCKSGKHAANGVAFNYCPFCGTDIQTTPHASEATTND